MELCTANLQSRFAGEGEQEESFGSAGKTVGLFLCLEKARGIPRMSLMGITQDAASGGCECGRAELL